MRLEGKRVLVSGAAGGIGRAVAAAFAAEGCTVWLADAHLEPARQAAQALGAAATAIRMDVADWHSVESAVKSMGETLGGIDVLVNCAGVLKTGPAIEATPGDWDEVCAVNLSGVFYCCKAVAPLMMAQGSGRIVNVASVSAARGGGALGNVLYGTTKAGVVALTKGLARELGPWHINVNAVAPSVLATKMTESLLTPERLRGIVEAIPLGRLALPEDVARVALMLASAATDYVTGETIAVDGGYLTR